jgi:sensor histidine kinase YesM
MRKINKKLLIVLIMGSIAPVMYFRIQEWMAGEISSVYELFESVLFNGLISVVVTLSIAWVVLSILHWLNQRYPWNENVLKRLFFEILLTFPVALLMGFILGNAAFKINPYHNQTYQEFIFGFLAVSGIMNFVLVAISDWFYFFEKWKSSLVEKQKSITEKEIIEKEKIAAQYEALKNQINPHFLFNSLNVISSLIRSNPDKAEDFVDEFAGLYRYILELNESAIVPLKEEVSITRSYAFMQKIRFGDALDFLIDIPDHVLNAYYIFPLSIQTLFENAVKHNRASKEEPLKIELTAQDESIQVKNNLQLRAKVETSTGIGTKNIILRYRQYELAPVFRRTKQHYIASLPLLKKSNIPN